MGDGCGLDLFEGVFGVEGHLDDPDSGLACGADHVDYPVRRELSEDSEDRHLSDAWDVLVEICNTHSPDFIKSILLENRATSAESLI